MRVFWSATYVYISPDMYTYVVVLTPQHLVCLIKAWSNEMRTFWSATYVYISPE